MTLAAPVTQKTGKPIWVMSDPHLFHANVLTFRDTSGSLIRPGFRDVHEMNAEILERWNERVKPGHKAYVLGDVVFGARDAFRELWPKFNGSKRLIVGNHDDVPFLSSGGFFKRVGMWRVLGEVGLLLTHVPVHPSTVDFGGRIAMNVHGHVHEKPSPGEAYRNVCVEQTGYAPVDLDQLVAEREDRFGPWPPKPPGRRVRG